MTRPGRASAALAAALAVPLGLAGCASAPADGDIESVVEAQVLTVPHVTGAFVGLASSGPSGRTLLVNIYVDSSDAATLATVADASLAAIWGGVPIRPVTVSIALAPVPKPDPAYRLEGDAVDPGPIASALAIDGSKVVRQLLVVDAASMDARYGVWHEPGK